MKRLVIVFVVAGMLGLGAGAFLWHAFGPLFYDRTVSEPLPPELRLTDLAKGTLRGADGRHRGKGEVRLAATASGAKLVRLTGLSVTNGPALEVWLVEGGRIASAADVKAAKVLSLGPLKGNIGDQTYWLPPGADAAAYATLVVWCEDFGVLFAIADLVTV